MADEPVTGIGVEPDTKPDNSPLRLTSIAIGPKRPRRPGRVADALSLTARQRRGMLVLLGVVLAVLLWRAARDRAVVDDPQPARPTRYADLADRLDPNTATWQELVALPQLGERRARAIVEHREAWGLRHPGDPAFKEPLDLVAVRGIGASMVETLAPFLSFPSAPAEPPGTRPDVRARP